MYIFVSWEIEVHEVDKQKREYVSVFGNWGKKKKPNIPTDKQQCIFNEC